MKTALSAKHFFSSFSMFFNEFMHDMILVGLRTGKNCETLVCAAIILGQGANLSCEAGSAIFSLLLSTCHQPCLINHNMIVHLNTPFMSHTSTDNIMDMRINWFITSTMIDH